jgi:hypothetical protein
MTKLRAGVLIGCMAMTAIGASPAIADDTIIDFDVLPNGRPIGPGTGIASQWQGVGVVFFDGVGNPIGISNNHCSLTAPNHAFSPTVIIAQFVDPATGGPGLTSVAGTAQDMCWVPGEGIDIYAYDLAGNLIAQQFNAGGGNLVLLSFDCPRIARLEMICVQQGIDNFQFETPIPAPSPDLNGDGTVDAADLALVLGAWGSCAEGCECPGDLNVDGAVDASDLAVLLGAWTSG